MSLRTPTIDTKRHPCFEKEAKGRYGRVHLPVAPKCNVQCNFCDRKFDCVNESRPGVCSAVLTPHQALEYLGNVLDHDPRISVVGLAGPGDPFANPDATMETVHLIRARHPEMIICLSSNGLQLPDYTEEIAAQGVSHITITVNAVDPDIAARIYAWVRYNKRVYRGREAGELLWAQQRRAIVALKRHGLIVKVNSIFMPEVNGDHIPAVAEAVAGLGADIHNIIPMLPVPDTAFEDLDPPSGLALFEVRAKCAQHIHQMRHCARCRADAVGLLGEANSPLAVQLLQEAAARPLRPQQNRPHVAVASREGVLVNSHLGDARSLRIYRREDERIECFEERSTPPVGGGVARWQRLADGLSDCFALLVSGIGSRPTEVLMKAGIRVVTMEGLIEQAVTDLYSGRPVQAPVRKFECGVGCAGTGTGCG